MQSGEPSLGQHHQEDGDRCPAKEGADRHRDRGKVPVHVREHRQQHQELPRRQAALSRGRIGTRRKSRKVIRHFTPLFQDVRGSIKVISDFTSFSYG